MKHVYVGQFGAFWRLTPEQWRQVCRDGAYGEGYSLEGYRGLKTKPRWLHPMEDDRGRYWTSKEVEYYEPFDWFEHDFKEHLTPSVLP